MWRPLTCVLVLVIVSGAETVSPPSCTFDNGWCQWRPLNNSLGFTWHMGSGPTIDRLSGPDGDHTTTHGKYIFIKGRDAQGKSRNTSAVLESDVAVTSGMQISFWYYMNGIGIGSLTLAMSEGNGSVTTLWEKEGRQGPSWIQATVDLPPGNYVISFKATTRLFYGSDLAIDDVEIGPVPTTTNPPPTTLPPSSELPFFCNFDSSAGLCGLQLIPSLGNTVGWNMTSHTKSFSHHGHTYIHGDASGEKGKYLLLSNWNQGENGDAAQIVSPFFRNDGASCLSLTLYLPGISSGTLSVYQKLQSEKELKLLHEEAYKNDVSGNWSSLLVTLKESTLFQVILEGSYTGYNASVIGVDDIKIEHGACVHTTTSVSTKPPTSAASPTSSETSTKSTKLTTKSVTSTQVGISSNPTTSLVSSNLHTSSTSLNKISTTMSSSLSSPEATSSFMTSTPSSVSSTTSSMTTPTFSSTSTFPISTIQRPTTTVASPASVSTTVSSTNSPAFSSTSVSSTESSTNSPALSSTSVLSTESSTNSPALSSTYVSSTVSSTTPSTLSSTSVSSTESSTNSPALSSTSVSSTESSTNSPALSSTYVSSTVSSTNSPALSSTSVSSTESSTNSPALSTTTVSPTVSFTTPSTLSLTSISSSVPFSIKHTRTMLTTEADIQTTTLKSEFTSLLNATKTSESSLSSTSSSTILLSTVMSVLQSTPSKKPTMKSSTPTSPTPEVTSSTDFPTEASNTSGRETTAIVLGVCLPIIALVIISVIVLICKKDNSMNSIQCQKRTRRKEEKYSNVTIEMSAKQNGVEHVQVAVTGFRTLET
uniref:Uncharacterized serine-rich protein C215.13-like isoform X2 n=1 Tax=Crassostrea virginica TaxID=6565 RepID=A0A8B8E637_CRAVI|nr:uncharacterized serine-rich protein C215.13-like isoform X2 [Crassostrea virginica]